MIDNDFKCDYQVYINERFVGEANDPNKVWDLIGNRAFGSLYRVRSETKKDVSDYVPF